MKIKDPLIPQTFPASGTRLDDPPKRGAVPLAAPAIPPSTGRIRKPGHRWNSLRLRSILLLAITLSWWNPPGTAFAQESLPLSDSVADGRASLGDIVLNEDLKPNVSLLDSLRLQAFELEIEQAQLEVTKTNFLHRLIPQIHVSASIGFKDVFFVDPSYNVLSVLPKDAYRLILTLPISELCDFSKNRAAELKLERLQLEFTRLQQQQRESQLKLQREFSGLEGLTALISDELKMKEEVLRFNDLRFQQGKIGYDVLIRSKLDVLNVKKSIYHLNRQIADIRFKLHAFTHETTSSE